MTSHTRLSLCTLTMLASSACIADEPSAGAPQTIKVAAAEPVAEGAQGERSTTFMLVQSEQGTCFAIAPPGGEGMLAGESYVVVAASGVDDALRQRLATDHPGCVLVDVVARAMKP